MKNTNATTQIILKGNLTRDPEYKTITLKDGRQIGAAELNVAVNTDRDPGTGWKTIAKKLGSESTVQYYKLTIWNNPDMPHAAEIAVRSLMKGSFIKFSGDVEINEWTSRNGITYKELRVHNASYTALAKLRPMITADGEVLTA